MLKSKTVAKEIEKQLNKNTKDEKFRVVYEVGSYKGTDINCVLKQGKGVIKPIANYTNVNMPYTLEVIMPVQCGEDRIDNVVDIVNEFIMAWNGKVKSIDNGKAVFLINPLEIGGYDSRATVGQSVIIKLDFNVEYSTSVGTKYEMALITTPFEYGTQNVRKFKDFEEKDTWVKTHIQNTNAPFYEILAPNLNSLVITQQRYLNPRGVDVNELLMHNYAVIKETKWNDDVKYYFYYVTGSNVDQYNLISLDLTMDTIATFYNDIEFGDCVIDRYHINRWKENTDNTVSFDGSDKSDLFETDGIDLPKRLTKRTKLSIIHTSGSTKREKINEWLNNNVEYWVYIFIDKNQKYKVTGTQGTATETPLNASQLTYRKTGENVSEDYGVLVYPVMKTNNDIIVKVGTIEYTLNYQGLDYFKSFNNEASYFYGIKYSLICPIDFDVYTSQVTYNIISDNLVIEDTYTTDNKYSGAFVYYHPVRTTGNTDWTGQTIVSTHYGLIMGCSQNVTDYETEDYSLDILTSFSKDEITKSDRNPKFNPKLLSGNYRSLKIVTSSGGDEFIYDVQKINNNKMRFLYTEPIQSEITRYYYRLKAPSGLYIEDNNSNYLGLVGSADNSRIYTNTAYAQFLANNKNFYMQNATNRNSELAFSLGQGLFGSVMSGMQGAFLSGGNPAGAIVGSGTSMVQTTAGAIKSYTTSKRNEHYTIDNLKSSPSLLSNASGNVIFNNFVTEMGLYVEEHEALESEIKDADDDMFMNGYTFGRVDNIKNVDNLRHYFNFIQAIIQDIKGNISTPIREDIRQRFANGVRFWNEDNIQYEKENYERWLNNE